VVLKRVLQFFIDSFPTTAFIPSTIGAFGSRFAFSAFYRKTTTICTFYL